MGQIQILLALELYLTNAPQAFKLINWNNKNSRYLGYILADLGFLKLHLVIKQLNLNAGMHL